MKRCIFIIVFIFVLTSCKNNSCNEVFSSYVHEKTDDEYSVLMTRNTYPEKALNKKYRKIITDLDNTDFLLDKLTSEKKTKLCIPNIVCPLTEGDVSLCMLIDMYEMSDAYFEKYLNSYVLEKQNGNSSDFWNYTHESTKNRNNISREIKKFIDLNNKKRNGYKIIDIIKEVKNNKIDKKEIKRKYGEPDFSGKSPNESYYMYVLKSNGIISIDFFSLDILFDKNNIAVNASICHQD